VILKSAHGEPVEPRPHVGRGSLGERGFDWCRPFDRSDSSRLSTYSRSSGRAV